MEQTVNLWPLIGIAAIVIGFLLRINAVLVVITAGIITGSGRVDANSHYFRKSGSGVS
ncbi:putative membrane protein [Yersinia pestis Pestoides A]|nr:putative membrane protein [Yersinia pestis Pestoides A]